MYVDEMPSTTDKLVSLSNKKKYTRYLNEMRLSIRTQQITAKCNSTQKSLDTARTIPLSPPTQHTMENLSAGTRQ
jgi:hypothetical protein